MKATYLKKPCPLLTDTLTKKKLAEYRLGGITFDYSLPQVWPDNHVHEHAVFAEEREQLYWQVCSECVTVYPPHTLDGEIVNLLTGEILT